MSKHHREQPHTNEGTRGMPPKPDDDRLAERTEDERVVEGLDAYNPSQVPPATDTRPRTRLTDSEQYREEKAEVDKEVRKGELTPDQLQARKDRSPYPPTHYDE
ncbi:DEAD/DEAH box helicase [Streptomyces sp. NPDC049954]|uniref:DEAD/DEAH box helicase n=1 Tax=Streptomyces sp. NPDC049954 TaxID=3155779 RepID=UPI00343B8E07